MCMTQMRTYRNQVVGGLSDLKRPKPNVIVMYMKIRMNKKKLEPR